MPNKLLILVSLAALAGCDGVSTNDAGVDAGVMVRMDSGPRTDGGPGDPCAAGEANAAETVECNGPLFGSTRRDNQIDGPCTPDGADGPGTCVEIAGLETWCAADEADPLMGVCVYLCPQVDTYVSTGGCPSGTRCFDLVDITYCFRDCNSAADCFAGEECDEDGSCVLPEPVPMDAGMPMDAGTPSDGGTPEAGT